MAKMRLGIDCGTCYSSAALMQKGSPKPVKEPVTHGFSFPSSILVTDQGDVLVGQAAENQRRRYPTRYQREFKRDLGRAISYSLGDRQMMPEDLMAQVIETLRIEAERMMNQALTAAVVTVPAHYEFYKQQLIEQAAKQAGFEEVAILQEPIAAALYYDYTAVGEQALKQGETLLVYDLGGGTFDAALVQKYGQGFKLLTQPVGDENCGGIDFDRQIYADLSTRCSDSLRQLLNPPQRDELALRTRLMVGDWCREFKHQLSELPQHSDLLILGAIEEVYTLSRADFEAAIAPLISRTCELCHHLIRAAGLEWQQIDRVLIVGGSCRIPYIRKTLEQQFCRPIVQVDELELAVCLGAAIYAATLDQSVPQNTVQMKVSNPPYYRPDGGFDAFSGRCEH
jgi:molecular chaperone DnaK (HSP70)